MRALYFVAGLIIGTYAAAWILEVTFPPLGRDITRDLVPDTFPRTETANDGRVWRWQATTPST